MPPEDPTRSRRSAISPTLRLRSHTASGAAAAAIMEHSDLYRLLVESVRDYAIFALDPTGTS